MDLRHLRYFVAVAEEAHFGRAAQRLHIVQPALSMQIRALEDEIGGPLFARTSRRVELTEAGALLLIEARRTLAQAERAMAIVQRSLRGETGDVKVGFAGNAVLTGKMIDDLREFHRRYPAVQIELFEMAPHLQVEAILAGQLDVGYGPGVGLAPDASLRAEKIGEWPMMVAMSVDHPFARKRRIPIKSMANETVIFYSANAADARLDAIRSGLTSVYRVSSTLSVLALAAAGLGLALVPAPVGNVTIPGLTYRPLAETDMQADLLLLSRHDETDPAVRAFVQCASATPVSSSASSSV